jgi:hypothetical protein
LKNHLLDRPTWTRALPWLALGLMVVATLRNVAGYNAASWYVPPVLLALVAVFFAVRARRWVDFAVSAFVVLAIPLWLLGIIVLFHFAGPLPNNAFSP